MSTQHRAFSAGHVPLAALLAVGLAPACVAGTPAKETPETMVGALHSAFGTHKARAVHAKGIMLEGSFTPAPDARQICRASLFTGGTIPVTVRFSDFTGIPDIPDTVGDANPRGFAVKFRMAKGASSDIVTHSFNGFPTATADEFAILLRAIGASGPGVPKPTPLDNFLASHPVAKTFLTTQKPAPASYATAAYFGVNAFTFTDAKGKTRAVRYRFIPAAGEHYLDAAAIAKSSPNYLSDEIKARVAAKPIVFDWYAQVSGPGDVIDNPSVAWPESRALVKLGTIRIDRLERDPATADRTTMFLPGNVPDGIAPADPMIPLRTAAYPISFSHRQ